MLAIEGKDEPLHKKRSMPQDLLTTREKYLENQIRKRICPPIEGLALKKVADTGGYEVHLTLRLPVTARELLLCENRDLTDIAKAIVTDLKHILAS